MCRFFLFPFNEKYIYTNCRIVGLTSSKRKKSGDNPGAIFPKITPRSPLSYLDTHSTLFTFYAIHFIIAFSEWQRPTWLQKSYYTKDSNKQNGCFHSTLRILHRRKREMMGLAYYHAIFLVNRACLRSSFLPSHLHFSCGPLVSESSERKPSQQEVRIRARGLRWAGGHWQMIKKELDLITSQVQVWEPETPYGLIKSGNTQYLFSHYRLDHGDAKIKIKCFPVFLGIVE